VTVRLAEPEPCACLPPLDREQLVRRAEGLLAALGRADAEISIALVGDATMAQLNRQHRGALGATDVLSFSLLEGEHVPHRGGLLGDVVIDLEVAGRQAREAGWSLEEEVLRLLIHGTLHLLGYDHEHPEDAARMEERERRLWDVLAG